MEVFPIDVFHRRPARHDRAMSAARVVFHLRIGDESAGVAVGRLGLIHIHNGAKLLQSQHRP